MTLLKPLRETLLKADLAAQRKSMGMKPEKLILHQVIAGGEAAEQAREYARELIARGALKSPPFELNCDQPLSDFMVEQAFKGAKGGMLLVTNIGHLPRRESFMAEAERALEKGHCIFVLCGTRSAVDIFLADAPDVAKHLPARTDMAEPAIQADLAAETARVREHEIAQLTEEHTVVQTAIQPMKPLTFVPKAKN